MRLSPYLLNLATVRRGLGFEQFRLGLNRAVNPLWAHRRGLSGLQRRLPRMVQPGLGLFGARRVRWWR